MSDAAKWSAKKGWGSKKNFAYEDWGVPEDDLADDEELKAQIAEDEKLDAKG